MEILRREDKINLVALIILVGFVLSVFFHYVKGAYFGLPYPHNTFLFLPTDAFNDFFTFFRLYEVNGKLNPYFGIYVSAQYPAFNMIAYLFTIFPPRISYLLFCSFIIFFFLFFSLVNLSSDKSYQHFTRVFIFTFLSYPLLFILDRGNFEGLLFIFLLAFLFFYEKKRFMISAFLLALGISMKLFPVYLVVLFLGDKKYKEAFVCLVAAVLITAACLVSFRGGFLPHLHLLVEGSNIGNNVLLSAYLDQTAIVQRGVTLFTFMKIIFIETGMIDSIDMAVLLKYYMAAMGLLSVLVTGYVLLIEKVFWRKAALLVCAMLLFPHISADYKLIHLFLPLFLFINSPEGRVRSDMVYAVMFALLLIPKDYYLLNSIKSDAGTSDISIAVLINPVIMVIMMGTIILAGLRNARMNDIRERVRDLLTQLRRAPREKIC